MVLPLLILLISLGLASSRVFSSDEEACLTLQNDVEYLRRAELLLGCQQQDVDNNNHNCHSVAQEKLQPCLLNSDISCLADNLAELMTYPNSPCFGSSQFCQSLENIRTSLLEKRNILCETPAAQREKRFVLCEIACTGACMGLLAPCIYGGPLAWGLCTTGCWTCMAFAMGSPC